MRVLKKTLLLFAAFTLTLSVAFVAILYNFAHSPNRTEAPFNIVEVKQGMTLRQVAGELERKDMVGSRNSFLVLSYAQGKEDQLRAGEYRLSPSMSPQEILSMITEGRSILHTVTIPEGLRIDEIAGILAEAGLADKETFLQEARNPELIRSLGLNTDSLEGYLFPETYRFSKDSSERQIVIKMVDTFRARALTPELQQRARSMNMNLHEVVTLASLIEKETGLARERILISSVFHNRLHKKMRLQTDPTVIYAMASSFDGNIRKKDLKIDSPYNTYLYRGLPPGPIASPGLESIVAAVNPAHTPNLYFVSRQDGSHEFSTNLHDHNRAVRKYQINPSLKG